MTDRSPQALEQRQPYGVVRADADEVLVDVIDAALTRLVELLRRRPSLIAALDEASDPRNPRALGTLTWLRDDPGIQAACTVHLSIEDAVQLATEIITAATPKNPPTRARVSVSGRGKNETTDHAGKDAR